MPKTSKVVKDSTHTVKLTVDGKDHGVLTIKIDRPTKMVTLSVTVPAKSSEPVGQVSWKVDHQSKKLVLDMPNLNPAMSGPCFLGCLIGAGAGFVNCILNAKTEDDVWRCIEDHAGTTGAGVLGCVIGCLS